MRTTEGYFETAGGQRLFERTWLPDGAPRAAIVLVHGYAEHSGRYAHTGETLASRGYAVYALDLRGHGRSDGDRVFVRSFNEYLDDVDALIARVRDRAGEIPIFMLGHSMGGAIVALQSITRRPPVGGVMLSGAVLTLGRGGGVGQRIATAIALVIGRLLPRMRMRKLDAATVSRDPTVVADYDADPLNFRGKMPAALISSMIRAVRTIEKRMGEIDQPILIMHGTEDQLATPEGSQQLYERVASIDRTLKLYDGLYHEILNEPERDDVLADITAWLDARTAAGASDAAIDGAAAGS